MHGNRHHHLRPAQRAIGIAFALSALVGASVADAGVTVPYTEQSSVTLAPGITHSTGTMRTTGNKKQAVQVGTIDLGHPQVEMRSLLSNDKVVKLERPSLNAQRNSRPGSQAIVATNGDVSVAGQTGVLAAPHSIHVQDGELMVSPECARPTLGIDADGTARIAQVRVSLKLEMGAARPKSRKWVWVRGVNVKRPTKDTIVLYTPRFAANTKTASTGTEVVVQTADTLSASGRVTATVVEIRRNAGSTPLLPGQMVLSANGAAMKAELERLWVGHQVFIDSMVLDAEADRCSYTAPEAQGWSNIEQAMGGNYYVTRNSVVAAPSSTQYAKGAVAAPRTAVGLTADGRALMVTVDGRQSGYSVGVTLAEMGQLMIRLGAVRAFNLDGGGSTVMAVRQPGADTITVSNRPSDGSERKLTQALAAFSTAP